MDVSPSRINADSAKAAAAPAAATAATVRQDNSKIVAKLSGKQATKAETATAEPKPPPESTGEEKPSSPAKVSSNRSCVKSHTQLAMHVKEQTAAAQTKIPMKRLPTLKDGVKTPLSPRNLQRPQMRSASKISLTIKELGGKKLDSNSSKLSFNVQATGSMKTIPPPLKCQTAREPIPTGISRRSASTISCRSVRQQKPEEGLPLGTLAKLPNSSAGDHLTARERVAENNKLKIFENHLRKLQDLQTEFMQKFETLKLASPDKLKSEYKFITMIRNDECKLVVKDEYQHKMPKKLPAESILDFKEKIKFAMDSCLNTLMDSLKVAKAAPADGERAVNLEDTHSKLEKEQDEKLNELYNAIDELCSTKDNETDSQIVKMQKEIQESKKALQLSEKKLADIRRIQTEEVEALEKELREKSDAELAKKETHISELNKKLKCVEKHLEKVKSTSLQNSSELENDKSEKIKLVEELKGCRENVISLNKKMVHLEQQLSNEKKEKLTKIECLQKLEGDLEVAKKNFDELKAKSKRESSPRAARETKEHHEREVEIQELKKCVEALEESKAELQQQVDTLMNDSNEHLETRNKLRDAENRIQVLEERERDVDAVSETSKCSQSEIAKLRQSETEKRREIEKLKVEVSRAHFSICQLQEQIQRDQQLLEVRSELINSLQTNDNSQRIHLEEMFAQVGEKNNTINEVGLNSELRTKAEEFRNLFTTLSTKQMELSRQEHMIKLLEESNERSQMLRVKQEEKIGRMEDEIAHLKQTISIYQNNVLGNAGCKSMLFSPVATHDDYNENFYYYTSERRRKRQVDINVKKYET